MGDQDRAAGRGARLCIVIAMGAVLGGAVVPSGTPAVAASAPASTTAVMVAASDTSSSAAATAAKPSAGCAAPQRPFTPEFVTIPGVLRPSRVLALGRDRNNVPIPPPPTARGKLQFAWDKASGIRPGSRQGVVRLSAHTFPRDGSLGVAIGNRLLTKLHPGAAVNVNGSGQRMCYRVAKQVRIPADQNLPAYYSNTGMPRLAILVCSGVRRGPGDWSHRTIWFAVPATSSSSGG